jgi:hypothetical protein
MKDVTMRRTAICPLNRLALSSVFVVALALIATAASAQSTIKRPGAHPRYSVELEPHALVQWFDEPFGDAGFGLGMRAVIPFFHNGPIQKINNNMGIGFGLDWSHFEEDNCGYYGRIIVRGPGPFVVNGLECSANQLWFPVYMQWNFFFTDVISVFGETGFAIRHESIDFECGGLGCGDVDNTKPRFIFQGGGRFLFGETVGLTVRVLYPFFPTVGASFLL